MSLPQYDIVFCSVRDGFEIPLVKQQFAKLFKLNDKQVDYIFNAKQVVLKTHVDVEHAEKYISVLAGIGVVAEKQALDSEFWRKDEVLPTQTESIAPVVKQTKSKSSAKKQASKAIHISDTPETAIESCELHQPVDFMYGNNIRRIPFIFTGNGVDYCQLWLVNILVCVLSAGLLYPWAHVRSLRYFYQNTQLDNAEFQYTSNPQGIFLIQFSLIIYLVGLLYAFFAAPMYFAVGVVLLMALLPLYWFESTQFQWRHSFYRNAGFEYKALLRDAYMAFLVWPLVILLSAGLLAPLAFFKIQQFIVQSKSVGKYDFLFLASIKNYLPLLRPLLFAELITGAVFYWRSVLPFWLSVLIVAMIWLYLFLSWRVILVNICWNSTGSKLGNFVATWEFISYTKLVLGNIVFCAVTFGFYWPWAKIRLAEYKAQHLAFYANQRFKKWLRNLE